MIFCLVLLLTQTYFCEGNAILNSLQILAIEWVWQISEMITPFPIYMLFTNFDLEKTQALFTTVSAVNMVHFVMIAFITTLPLKYIWSYMYQHKGKVYDFACALFGVLDIVCLIFYGWKVVAVALPTVLCIILTSFLKQSKNEKALKEQFDYYNKLMETQKQREKEISVIRHDIANHLNVMEEMQKDEEGQKLLKKIDKKSRNFTGIPVVDCLIREKEKLCEKEGISFIKEGVTIEDTKISEYELVSLFANLLDNAIEAAKNVRVESENRTAEKETENAVGNVVECIVENPREDVEEKVAKRMVKLEVTRQQGYIKIVVRNTKLSTQTPIDNNFMTTKKEKSRHGLGNYIVREIVEKKDGRVTYCDEGDTMNVIVLLQL